MKLPIKHIDIILIGTGALLCAIGFVLLRNIAANRIANEWLIGKRTLAISCNNGDPYKAGSPGDSNGGCAHQSCVSGLLTARVDKRNKNHTC